MIGQQHMHIGTSARPAQLVVDGLLRAGLYVIGAETWNVLYRSAIEQIASLHMCALNVWQTETVTKYQVEAAPATHAQAGPQWPGGTMWDYRP